MCDTDADPGGAAANAANTAPTNIGVDSLGDIGGAVGAAPGGSTVGPGVSESMGDIGAAATGGNVSTGSNPSGSSPGQNHAMTIAGLLAALFGMTPVGIGLNLMGDGPLGLGLMHHGSPTATTGGPTDPGGFNPLVLSGMPEMTTRAPEGAFAPGGAVASVMGGDTGIATTGSPSQAQRANASARTGGGLSPAFLENLELLKSLQ